MVKLNCDIERLTSLERDLSKVRSWLTGFKEAGKMGPPSEDCLRQLQILIKEAITAKTKKGGKDDK